MAKYITQRNEYISCCEREYLRKWKYKAVNVAKMLWTSELVMNIVTFSYHLRLRLLSLTYWNRIKLNLAIEIYTQKDTDINQCKPSCVQNWKFIEKPQNLRFAYILDQKYWLNLLQRQRSLLVADFRKPRMWPWITR